MTVTVFLDTNIIQSDYKMESSNFKDLLKVTDGFRENEKFKLYITEMNENEISNNYIGELNQIYNKLKEYNIHFSKVINSSVIPGKKQWRSQHLENFKEKLNSLVETYYPTDEVNSNAVNRYYSQSMPFRDNKEEFKDSIIWESIYEYAKDNSDETIYFISKNTTEFAQDKKANSVTLHEDFDDLNGRITYMRDLTEFLREIEELKVMHFDFREHNKIKEVIKEYISWGADESIDWAIHSYFTNHEFESEYFSGWGTDPYISKVEEVEIADESQVLEGDGRFIIPIIFDTEIDYYVENKNPTYERGYDDEFIQSEQITDTFTIECKIDFDAESNKVVEVSEVEFIF